jgi:NADH dehydrogenase
LISWAVSFIGRGRAERTITEQQVFGRQAIERLAEIEAAATKRQGTDAA